MSKDGELSHLAAHRLRPADVVGTTQRHEAAAVLRRILDAVEHGTLEAVGPASGLVRQIQGAAAALEVADDAVEEPEV